MFGLNSKAERRFGGDKVLGLHPGLAIFAVGLWAGDSTSLAPSFLISKKEPVGMSSDARIVGGTQHLALDISEGPSGGPSHPGLDFSLSL